MTNQLPPKGTRGAVIPRPLRPVFRAMMGVGNVMFRRGMKVQGRPLLRLTTVGARTGKKRKAVLGWFPDGDRDESWVIVASNGGAPNHPGWAYNLAAHPEEATIETGDDASIEVRAELVTGPERERLWEDIAATAPGYLAYTEKTDRELPVFRLNPR